MSSDASQVASGSAQQGANAASTIGNQQITETKSSGGYTGGKGVQAARSGIANGLGSAADSCTSALQGQCSGQLAPEDQKAAEQAKAACQEISQGAKQAGAERAAEGGDMGDLSKLAQMAAGALGPLAQMMGGGDKGKQGGSPNQSALSDPSSYGTSPTPSSLNTDGATQTVDPVTGTNLGSSTAPSSTALGVPEGGGLGMNSGYGYSGGPIAAMLPGSGAKSAGAHGDGRNFGASSGFGANGNYGTGAGAGLAGSAGGTGGPANSSGASSAADYKNADGSAADAAAAAGENGYDLAGGSRPILGLKGKSSEAAELEGMAGANGDPAAEENAGDRDLASTSEEGEGQGMSGLTLFHMVKSRYSELKRSGRI
jgi:hypothetical protein